jgi:uncharacterized membrane protein YdbT with pleckstrin-like domain
MIERRVIINKVWRSELPRLILFIASLFLAPLFSAQFPPSVIHGELLNIGSQKFYLSLPLFWLVPCAFLINVIFHMYNVWYTVDAKGIEARDGILSVRQVITRIRFEDIRSIETDQSLLERILSVGTVRLGTAATDDWEVYFHGVDNPKKLQRWLLAERDERQKAALNKENLPLKEQIEVASQHNIDKRGVRSKVANLESSPLAQPNH